MSETRDPNERGALWEKQSRKGTYFTGTVDGQPCVVFKNDRKAPGSKAPDWRVLKPQPREERDTDQRVPDGPAQINDDDIQF